jgi:hypothetical protein
MAIAVKETTCSAPQNHGGAGLGVAACRCASDSDHSLLTEGGDDLASKGGAVVQEQQQVDEPRH